MIKKIANSFGYFGLEKLQGVQDQCDTAMIALEKMEALVYAGINLLGEAGPGFDDPRVVEIQDQVRGVWDMSLKELQSDRKSFRRSRRKEE
jgi:hypothetical protein